VPVNFCCCLNNPGKPGGGIDSQTARALQDWVNRYTGPVPLTVSEMGADGLPICNPVSRETELRSYAHIDALGTLKRSSFDRDGTPIGANGIMQALNTLQIHNDEERHENLAGLRI